MKGRLEEVLSKALYADDPELYTVEYRDMDEVKSCSLPEFLRRSDGFGIIPASRIVRIRKEGKVVFERNR
jgi:uncharacterized protein (UPF0248 family)